MKRATFNYIKKVLSDYPHIEEYIERQRKESVTIDQDKRLTALEKNRAAVQRVLRTADGDTRVIIQEIYMKENPIYSLGGLSDSNLVFAGRTKAFDLRDAFFERMALELNLLL